MARADRLARRCPECDAVPLAGATKCWLCRASLPPESRVAGKTHLDDTDPGPIQFSIETLLLVTTLAAVCLEALVSLPGLGVVALFIAVPALVRTCLTGVAGNHVGQRLTASDKVMAFFASAGITCAAFVAAFIAFFSVCTASFLTGMAVGPINEIVPGGETIAMVFMVTAVVLCCAAGVAAFVGTFWRTWPRKGR
jgi:hypothetical protein